MPVIKSLLNPRSEEFRANVERMRGLVEDVRQKAETVSRGGDEASRRRHVARPGILSIYPLLGLAFLPFVPAEREITSVIRIARGIRSRLGR